jgi:hypothetical protein
MIDILLVHNKDEYYSTWSVSQQICRILIGGDSGDNSEQETNTTLASLPMLDAYFCEIR